MKSSPGFQVFTTALLLLPSILSCSAQYAWFSRNTDTISVSGQTEATNQCTIEAVFLLPSSEHSGGNLFDEWVLGQEEKYLGVSNQSIDAIAFPNNELQADERRGLISLD